METTKRILRDVSIVVQVSSLLYILGLFLLVLMDLFYTDYSFIAMFTSFGTYLLTIASFSLVFAVNIWYFFFKKRLDEEEKLKQEEAGSTDTNSLLAFIRSVSFISFLVVIILLFPVSFSSVHFFGCTIYPLFNRGNFLKYLEFIFVLEVVYMMYTYVRYKGKFPFFRALPTFRFLMLLLVGIVAVNFFLFFLDHCSVPTPGIPGMPGVPVIETPIYLKVPIISKLLSL